MGARSDHLPALGPWPAGVSLRLAQPPGSREGAWRGGELNDIGQCRLGQALMSLRPQSLAFATALGATGSPLPNAGRRKGSKRSRVHFGSGSSSSKTMIFKRNKDLKEHMNAQIFADTKTAELTLHGRI